MTLGGSQLLLNIQNKKLCIGRVEKAATLKAFGTGMRFRNRLNIFWSAGLAALLLMPCNLVAQDLESAETAQKRARNAQAETLAPKTYESAEDSLNRARRLREKGSNPARITAAFREATEEFEAAELEAFCRIVNRVRYAVRVGA